MLRLWVRENAHRCVKTHVYMCLREHAHAWNTRFHVRVNAMFSAEAYHSFPQSFACKRTHAWNTHFLFMWSQCFKSKTGIVDGPDYVAWNWIGYFGSRCCRARVMIRLCFGEVYCQVSYVAYKCSSVVCSSQAHLFHDVLKHTFVVISIRLSNMAWNLGLCDNCRHSVGSVKYWFKMQFVFAVQLAVARSLYWHAEIVDDGCVLQCPRLK